MQLHNRVLWPLGNMAVVTVASAASGGCIVPGAAAPGNMHASIDGSSVDDSVKRPAGDLILISLHVVAMLEVNGARSR